MKNTDKTTVTVESAAHRRARIAAGIVGETVGKFVSKAADERSVPLLKKHHIKLNEPDSESVSQAA